MNTRALLPRAAGGYDRIASEEIALLVAHLWCSVAIYEIGCFFGAILAFAFGERLGRRWTIMIGCAILVVGAAIQTAAYGIPQMIAGRIVAGLGNGLNTATIRKSTLGIAECMGDESQPLTTSSCMAL